MAIYHCSVKLIGRNEGRSVVAAAAYRSGECIKNEYDGLTHDYTRKHWVEHTEIILPDNAPAEYKDRCTLWNSVEEFEKSKNAQLAREFELALPVELDREQQIELVRKFCTDVLVSDGMIVDACFHNPPITNDLHQPIDSKGNPTNNIDEMEFHNPHVHILTTVRPIDENGNWEKKSRVEYICKRGEEEQAFTADEYKEAKKEGWEKQFRYYEDGKKVYYTSSVGEEKGLERVSNNPKTTPYGRQNDKVKKWNSREQVKVWRKAWEDCVNEALERAGINERVDSRSYIEQGRLDEIPSLHMGKSANYIEKKAQRELREGVPESEIVHSDIGRINLEIKEHNRIVRELKEMFNEAVEKAKEWLIETAKRFEAKRALIISNIYNSKILNNDYISLKNELSQMANIKKYDDELIKVNRANTESQKAIKEMQEQLNECKPHQIKLKRELQSEIKNERAGIENRKEYLQQVKKQCGISSDSEFKAMKRDMKQKEKMVEALENNLNSIDKKISIIKNEYETESKSIDEKYISDIKRERLKLRPDFENIIRNKIEESSVNEFDKKNFNEAVNKTDSILDGSGHIRSRAEKKTKSMHR